MIGKWGWLTWLVCTALPVLPCAPVVAKEPAVADAKLAGEVRQAIDGLAAATRAERAAARQKLLDLGPPVLWHLPPPELLPTASVRASVELVRQELERRHARESVEASRVRLQGKQSLGQWIAQIAGQTRNPIDASNLPAELRERELAFDGPPREFWPALDDLASRGGFSYDADVTRRGLILRSGRTEPGGSPVVAYAGPFRLSASPADVVSVRRGEAEDGRPGQRLARVVMAVQAEPRLRPLFLQYAAADFAARNGAVSLKPFSPEASYEVAVVEGGGKSRLQLDFVLPDGEVPRVLDVEGMFRMTTAAGSTPVRFVDVTQHPDGKEVGIDRRRGGVTVTLHRVRRERGERGRPELRVRVTVTYDQGGPAFESHRSWMLHNEVFLESADGARLPVNGGYEMTLQADGAVGMEYRFVDLPDPLPEYAFVYVAPTLIVDVPVEFALKSLPVAAPKAGR